MRILILLILLFPVLAYGDTNSNNGQLLIQEVNGTNSGRYRVLIFPNGSTTNNGDGSITVNFGGGSSCSSLLLQSGGYILLQNNGKLNLQNCSSSNSFLLLQTGAHLLLQSGGFLIL